MKNEKYENLQTKILHRYSPVITAIHNLPIVIRKFSDVLVHDIHNHPGTRLLISKSCVCMMRLKEVTEKGEEGYLPNA